VIVADVILAGLAPARLVVAALALGNTIGQTFRRAGVRQQRLPAATTATTTSPSSPSTDTHEPDIKDDRSYITNTSGRCLRN
jgi:hypothetical protein